MTVVGARAVPAVRLDRREAVRTLSAGPRPATTIPMNDPLALVPISTGSPPSILRFGARPVLPGFFVGGLLAMALFLGGAPLLSMCVLTASALSSFLVGSVLGSAQDGPTVTTYPEEIASSELRATYRSILIELAEIERTVEEAPRIAKLMATAIGRARDAVELAGQIALLANPLQRYLDRHAHSFVRSELQRLRERTEAASDETAVAAWNRAVTARTQQLAIHDQIIAQLDRICARLELVRAGLETLSATMARLRSADEEQVVLADASVTDQLDEMREDLAACESALEVEAAA